MRDTVSPQPTFADGLSPRQILDQSQVADAEVRSVKTRVVTESVAVDGEPEREVYEVSFADEQDYHMKLIEGFGDDEEGGSPHDDVELLLIDETLYTRDSPDDAWKENAELSESISSISGIRDSVLGDAAAVATESGSAITRLPDENLHGQRMLRIGYDGREGGDELRRQYEQYLSGLREEGIVDEEVPEFPEELIPDEHVITGELWIGADDFHMHRLMMTSRATRDGEVMSESNRVFDSWDHNQSVSLPDPTSTQ